MKKNSVYSFLFFLPLVFAFTSCQESCNCTKDLGCTIMTAISYSDNTLKERRSYCSDVNYYTDNVRLDSVHSFSLRHSNDGSGVATKDSIYYSQTTQKIKTQDTKHYENLGYTCTCLK